MARASESVHPKGTGWLQHDWPFEVHAIELFGRDGFEVIAGGYPLHHCGIVRQQSGGWRTIVEPVLLN